MFKIRNLTFLTVIAALLFSSCTPQAPVTTAQVAADTPAAATVTATLIPVSATPEPTQEIDPALQAALDQCANIYPGQACFVEGPVVLEAQPDRYLMPFTQPGQTVPLADLQRIKLGEPGSTRGVVVMRIQTEWPEGAFTALAFGDVELVNEVPFGTREFNPMQSLTLVTGPNEADQPPASGFLVASPEDGSLSTLVVNGVELSFGSAGLLTGSQGGLSIQTIVGVIGAWLNDTFVDVFPGQRLDLSRGDIDQGVADQYAIADRDYRLVDQSMKKYAEAKFWDDYWKRLKREDPSAKIVEEALKKYRNSQNIPKDDPAYRTVERSLRLYYEARAKRLRQKRWKGGWWKMTYGPMSSTGQCAGAVGDGDTGGEPFTIEIPICRGNNGRTILMYDSGVSYDQVAPNLFTQGFLTEFDLYGNGNFTTEGHFMSLQIVSPTRMILSNAQTQDNSCTTAAVVYLDFLRDDPNVRCGEIIYISPFTTPEAPTPTPEPEIVDPPVEGQYRARLGLVARACDPAAQPYAPNFTTAALSLSPENQLVLDTDKTIYELPMSNLTYPYSSRDYEEHIRQGIFSLEQPIDSSFNLMMTLVQLPGQQWTGNWLVSSVDATQLCTGTIDLLPPD